MNEIDNNKRWTKVSRRSLKGGIISLDHFSVCERGEFIIIKAGIFRLLKRLGLFFIIGCFIVGLIWYLSREGQPDDDGRVSECYFLLFLIFLAVSREIFVFFQSGGIELCKESGNVCIRHGLFFRRRRQVSVPKEKLKVRFYQNRQGGRDRDIEWGHLILSLKHVDDSREELILCKSRKGKRIKKAFEIIHEYFGQGEVVGVDDFIQEETSKQPCTADPEWHSLAIRSRTKGPLLGFLKPITRIMGNELKIFRSPVGILVGLGGVLFVIILFLVMLIPSLVSEHAFETFTMILFFIGFTAVLYCTLCRVERISFNQLQSKFCIHHGILFFDKRMEYSLNDVKVKFYRSNQEDVSATVRTGDTVFSIIYKYAPEDELILFKSTNVDCMQSLHDTVCKAMGLPAVNEIEESLELPDGKIIQVPKSSAFNWNEKLSINRSILQSGSEQFIMKRDVSRKTVAFWFLVTPLLFVLAFFFVLAASPEGELGKFVAIIGSLFVLLFGCMIVWHYVLEFWGQMYLVAYKSDERVYYQFCRNRGKTSALCDFDEICAVQLCMSHRSDSDKNNGNPFAVFEINIVVGEPDIRRIPVAAGEDEDKIRMCGDKLALFFNKPLIDHI